MAGISDPLQGFVPAAESKLLVLGSSDSRSAGLMNRARSLNLEHVSPAPWNGPEISRRPSPLAANKANQLLHLRRWFFARKPDAGFVLTDFPATLLQAKVFDDFLEVREQALSVVVAGPRSPETVVEHSASPGHLLEPGKLGPA